jgi:predicted nucleic acid-binding protein
METVYIETSVVSYLTSRPSRDLVLAAHQALTRQWWEEQRRQYHCVVSALVLDEAADGDPEAARLRLESLAGIPVVEITPAAEMLADRFVNSGVLPPHVTKDAVHIAIAAVAGIKYLLTWNCRHIANVHVAEAAGRLVAAEGFRMPILCTPLELQHFNREEENE